MAFKKLNLNLVGKDGNAYFLLGYAKREARKAGWSNEKIEELIKEATNGDYQHLLSVLLNA